MGYADVAALQQDADFARRTQACYATETLDGDGTDPGTWQAMHSWVMAAQPGFGDAYASALAQEPPNPRPGNDPSVITDSQILGAVQAILTAEAPPSEPVEEG
jgi:hypothetical protein